MKNTFLVQTTKLTILVAWFSFFVGCANVIPPSGGPKDEVPPKLLDSLSYPNKTYNTNRNGSNIILVFNEATDVVSLKSQLTSTPLIDTKVIKYKTKSITLKDTSGKSYKGTAVNINLNQHLDSNTTYVLNFGRAFKDINEGKIATNISIAFSTGALIDLLSVKGQVRFNTTGKLGKEVMVGLYPINDTSNAMNTLPKYYTSTDKHGKFEINYLKNGTYLLACFTDKNRNNKYDQRTELIAFYPETIKLDSAFNAGDLLLFKEDKREPTISRMQTFDNLAIINFNKGLEKVEIDNYNNDFFKFDDNRKKLSVYQKLLKDTTFFIKMTDSTGLLTDSTVSLHFNSLKKYNKKSTLSSNYQYINKELTQLLSFSQPIFETHLDSSSVYAKDSTYNFDSIIDLKWNLNKTKLIISAHLPKYHDTLFLNNLNFVSVLGDTLSKSTAMVRAESGQFGSVFFKVFTNEPHYIIDLLDQDHNTLATGRNVKELSLLNYQPQNVFIRILIDRNNNGKYDNGDYLKNELPEEYIYIKEGVKIKAGWDVELNIEEDNGWKVNR
jgi:uncharacterized protein (DUF2141 family)